MKSLPIRKLHATVQIERLHGRQPGMKRSKLQGSCICNNQAVPTSQHGITQHSMHMALQSRLHCSMLQSCMQHTSTEIHTSPADAQALQSMLMQLRG